ncbi:aldo/keto reductase [Natrinema gelatinilyticum]|uniref:aldo/keto reductase n=1 Tax=Natrinema gelatinilyticum TaxID=2961571 RepID=UPI0020C57E25|nr:aldo/keto reductase [Natrinema gelatinilyticum]
MKYELTDDYTVSPIIKGGWQLSESHSDNKSATPVADMFEFVDAGITTFDCADIYTGVEDLIGAFRDEYRSQRGEEPPVQVHTKFVPDRDQLESVDRPYAEQIIDRSRERLSVEALDLVQFHWWDYSIDNYVETAGILADLHEEGKIRHIGVTNFDAAHLRELLDAGVPVVSNQVQYSLLDDRPEREMVNLCGEEGIQLLCYGTLAGGFLTEKFHGEPDPGEAETLENRSLTKYKLIIEDAGGWEPYQDLLGVVESIADKHGVSIANVATRYVLERPQVCGAIVGARDTSHLDDNLRTLEFSLDKGDHRRIEDARSNLEELPGGIYGLERGTGKHARIMKYNLNEE